VSLRLYATKPGVRPADRGSNGGPGIGQRAGVLVALLRGRVSDLSDAVAMPFRLPPELEHPAGTYLWITGLAPASRHHHRSRMGGPRWT
jgi:hypothetical protein